MRQAPNEDDTWQTLSAATEKLLEKRKPETEKKTPDENHSNESRQREAERAEVRIRTIDKRLALLRRKQLNDI